MKDKINKKQNKINTDYKNAIGPLILFIFLLFAYKDGIRNVLGSISSKFLANESNIMFASPTPIPASCNIGKFSFTLPKTSCTVVQKYIEQQRKQDSAKIELIINALNAQIQKINTPTNNVTQSELEAKLNNALNGCTGNESEVYRCKLTTLGTLTQIYGQEYQKQRELESQLREQQAEYQNYLSKIQFGGIGNGACSSHEGVDCSTPRGNIGQVMCADGWSQSQIYYYNVEECVKYYIDTNFKNE